MGLIGCPEMSVGDGTDMLSRKVSRRRKVLIGCPEMSVGDGTDMLPRKVSSRR
jgi:hypothetical protein